VLRVPAAHLEQAARLERAAVRVVLREPAAHLERAAPARVAHVPMVAAPVARRLTVDRAAFATAVAMAMLPGRPSRRLR